MTLRFLKVKEQSETESAAMRKRFEKQQDAFKALRDQLKVKLKGTTDSVQRKKISAQRSEAKRAALAAEMAYNLSVAAASAMNKPPAPPARIGCGAVSSRGALPPSTIRALTPQELMGARAPRRIKVVEDGMAPT